jgi:hypothetical protein
MVCSPRVCVSTRREYAAIRKHVDLRGSGDVGGRDQGDLLA